MVEFGLKLEDNKVADWSEHYIRYEQLKEILVKCARAQGRLAELRTKRPRVAQQVIEAYAASPQSSKDNLLELDAVRGSVTEQHPLQQQHVGAGGPSGGDDQQSVQSEEASLLRTDSGYYGSTQSLFRSESGISIAHSLHKMASGVTDYFSKSFERTVRDTLKLVKDYQRDFDNLLLEDIQLVNAFYQLQLTNMTQRLDLLKESVAQSFAPPPPTTGEDDPRTTYLETPLRASRKNRVKDLVAKFQKKLSSPMQKTRKYNLPDFHTAYNDESSSVLESSPQQTKELKQQQEREAESIQRALVDLYRTAKLLQNFCIMNYTGFVKIVKKHDKTNKENKNKYASAVQSDTICNAGKDVETLADTMEVLYANWFCDRNKVEARAQLLPKKGDGLEMDWSQLRLGYRMGMCSILGLWVCWDCVWGMVSNGTSTIGGRTAFPVFRACGGLLILQWFWGCNVWIWTRYRINYIFLFDFNPNFVASPIVIFNEAVDHSLVFLIVMLLYYKAGAHAIPFSAPAGVLPTGLVLYTLCHLVFPWRKRKSMWEAVRFVVTAPMTSPTFFHGYVGDVFTSMVKVFQDMVWTLGFVFSGDFLIPEESKHSTDHLWSHSRWYKSILIPAVTLLPLCIRFNQCLRRYTDTGQRFPHLANSLKYVLSQLVTLFGAFHPLYLEKYAANASLFQIFWVLIFVASSLYSFAWDVTMDWGLGRPSFAFLGPRLMYPKRIFYYLIIAIDLVLRFAWVLTLVPPNSGAAFAIPAYLTAVSMMLELFRRSLWGFLRLENEHRSNASGFRRVNFVPLHFSTGHKHGYSQEKEHRGFSVLLEVAFITLVVIAAAVASVVAAQQQTEKLTAVSDEL